MIIYRSNRTDSNNYLIEAKSLWTKIEIQYAGELNKISETS